MASILSMNQITRALIRIAHTFRSQLIKISNGRENGSTTEFQESISIPFSHGGLTILCYDDIST